METWLFLEGKKTYTRHLQDILAPRIHEGIMSLYDRSVEMNKGGKVNTLFQIFEETIAQISSWTPAQIVKETARIKLLSESYEYLDGMVKAVIKVSLLACTHNNTVSETIAREFANNFTTEMLVHRCYMECGKYAHNNPHMFHVDSRISSFQRRSQESAAIKEIRKVIGVAVRKCLPYTLMLKEYLVNLDVLDRALDVRLISKYQERVSERMETHQRLSGCSERHSLFEQMVTKDEKDRDRVRDLLVLDDVIESIKEAQDSAHRSEKKKSMLEIQLDGRIPSGKPVNMSRSSKSSRETKPATGPRRPGNANLPDPQETEVPYRDQDTSVRPTRMGVKLIEEYN